MLYYYYDYYYYLATVADTDILHEHKKVNVRMQVQYFYQIKYTLKSAF